MRSVSKQKGLALLVFVTVLLSAATAMTVRAMSGTNTQTERDKITAAALAQAKDALIGYAASDQSRPGELPCPDVNGDGILSFGIDYNFGNRLCTSFIGYLPWKTLDLPELRDGANEKLWYAISQNFYAGNSSALNSDTKGMLTVYSTDGTLLANQAAAIVFSPGNALPGQDRSSANLVSNYLDQSNCPGVNCRDNTVATGPFFLGPVLDSNGNPSLNDKLMVIQAKDIFPAVEKRVAKELSGWLQSYFAANHYYPYPAPYNDCDPNNSHHCRGDSSVCKGRIPRSEASGGNADWNPPNWFVENQWYREIYYSAGKASLQSATGITCQNTLNVSGSAVGALFFMPGTPIGSVNRPSNALADYLEDPENQDGWSTGANDTYVIPTSASTDRDRLYSLP